MCKGASDRVKRHVRDLTPPALEAMHDQMASPKSCRVPHYEMAVTRAGHFKAASKTVREFSQQPS